MRYSHPLKVGIKKLIPEAVIPKYARPWDAGMDLVATSRTTDDYGNVVYGTGIALEVPEGFVAFLFPRSSNSKTDLYLTNSVWVIDSGYRWEIFVKYRPSKDLEEGRMIYEVGDRVVQLVILPFPEIHFEEKDELEESVRGTGGFGSTGS